MTGDPVGREAIDDLLKRVSDFRYFNLGQGAEQVPADDVLEVLCTRRLDHIDFPVIEIESSYLKRRRDDGQVCYETIVMIAGQDAGDDYEALGIDVGDSEDPSFWLRVFIALKARGLSGVEVVVSEPHGGLEEALSAVFPEAQWRRDLVDVLDPDALVHDDER